MGYFQVPQTDCLVPQMDSLVPQISQIYTDFYSVPVYYKARECVISS